MNPVCGMAIDTSAPEHVESYDGIDYYFCCDRLLDRIPRGTREVRDDPPRRSGKSPGLIGIGAVKGDRSPPTPPGMRVRTGRFEKLRS